VAVKTCKKDCSPENKDKFLSEAGTLQGGGLAALWGGWSLLTAPHRGAGDRDGGPGGVCRSAVVGG